MSDLITTTTQILPPSEPTTTGIMSGFTLDMTLFIIGIIFMLMVGYLLVLIIFGQPITTAKNANSGGCIIQHTNTPKSAIMKIARVGGDGFQYKDVRDGTVAATPDSVFNIQSRQLVFTFSDLGVTIPLKLLTGVSILVHNGISGLAQLKENYFAPTTPLLKYRDPDTDEIVLVQSGEPEEALEKDDVLVEGYDFSDFKKLLKQSKEEHVIPLTVESVPNFIDKNISAVTTERKLTVMRNIMYRRTSHAFSNPAIQIAGIAFAIALIILMSTVIK